MSDCEYELSTINTVAESTALSGTNVTCFILWLKFADAVHARPVPKGEQALPWEGRKHVNWIKKNERRLFPTRLIRLSSTSTPTKYSRSGLWKSKGMMCSVKPSWRGVVKLVHRVEARWLATCDWKLGGSKVGLCASVASLDNKLSLLSPLLHPGV